MNTAVSSQAWSILSSTSTYALEQVGSDLTSKRTAIEASRIACLNMVLNKYYQTSSNIIAKHHGTRLSNFSYSAEQDGLLEDEVKSLAVFLYTQMEDILIDVELEPLSTLETVYLLTEIHSLGSYIFPSISNIGTSPRIIGAFYTPLHVSDYIAERTIGPVIDSLIQGIPKRGFVEYNRLLNMKVLDPACGSGAFLISALKVFMTRKQRAIEAIGKIASQMLGDVKGLSVQYAEKILGNLYGVDLDAGALEISKISLHLISDKLGLSRFDILSNKNNFRRGNSLISLGGSNGSSDHSHFFNDSDSRYPFEWFDEFPDIFINGGFNFILMNPPYNRLKPNRAEFKRERQSDGYQTFQEVDYIRYKKRLQEDVDYFKNSGEYKTGNRYSIDTYRLFLERSLSLTKPNGRIGFIVPSTLLGDISAAPLRRELIMNNKIHFLNEFPEGAKIFPGVTQSVCIMVLERGATTETIDASFGLQSINEARYSKYLRLKLSNIENSMGKSLTIPRISMHEWKLLERLHENPSLGSLDWLLCRRGELDLTLHKKYITTKNKYSPLIRGSHIARYSLNGGSSRVREYVNTDSFNGAYKNSERMKHIESARIACQQISNRSQRWRLKFSLISPGTVLANSCNYIVLCDKMDEDDLYYLLGILNSDLINWRFDICNANNHVSNWELNALPIVNYPRLARNKLHIVDRIKDEAHRLVKSKERYSSQIEGYVFYLYGLDENQAEVIMRSRGATHSETERTLAVLEDLMQNE